MTNTDVAVTRVGSVRRGVSYLLGLLVCATLVSSCDGGPTSPGRNPGALMPSGAYRFQVMAAEVGPCSGGVTLLPVTFDILVTRNRSSWSARLANPDLGHFELLLEDGAPGDIGLAVTGFATGAVIATHLFSALPVHITFEGGPESRTPLSGGIYSTRRQDFPIGLGESSGALSATAASRPETCSFSGLLWRIYRP